MKDWLLHGAIEKDEKMATPTMAVTDWPCTRQLASSHHPSCYCRVANECLLLVFFFDLRCATGCAKVSAALKVDR